MTKNILNILNIVIFLFFVVSPLSANEWYAKAAKLHKEWAKTYHKVSDLERYTNIHKLVIGKDTSQGNTIINNVDTSSNVSKTEYGSTTIGTKNNDHLVKEFSAIP